MPGFIDLHTHTCASDGSMRPEELVRYAEGCGLDAVAVTDHDTVAGLEAAHKAAQGLSIEVVNGIELSADYPQELHILGYFIDPYAAILQGAVHQLQKWRGIRNGQMIARLCELGFDITPEEVLARKPGADMASIGRVHMALAMVEKGYIATVQEAFDKYLTKTGKAYIERQRFSPQKSIEIIKQAGGYAFFAHPILTVKNPDELAPLVDELIGYGLDGIECYHSAMTEEYSALCRSICAGRGLMVSGGSDFHGENRPEVKLGQVYGGQYIEADILLEIKRKIGLVD